MSLWWLLDRVKRKTVFLEQHRRCKRCGLFYRKENDICNNCSDLSDEQLELAVRKRKSFRVTLGKAMILAGLLIGLVLIAAS